MSYKLASNKEKYATATERKYFPIALKYAIENKKMKFL